MYVYARPGLGTAAGAAVVILAPELIPAVPIFAP